MAVVYLYVPVEKAEVIVECGLKLSEWKNKNVQTPWSSFPQPCICALLHPDDDKRSKDSAFQCIKLDIPAEDCIIADKDLYNLSLESPDIKQNISIQWLRLINTFLDHLEILSALSSLQLLANRYICMEKDLMIQFYMKAQKLYM